MGIKLTQEALKNLLDYNQETGVFLWKDREDNRLNWNKRYSGKVAGCIRDGQYIDISIYKKTYLAHRLAWLYVYGKWPDHQIDHINGLKADNRIINLRDVTPAENCKNILMSDRNTSGITGVHWTTTDKHWISVIRANNNYIYLGMFKGKFEACCARKSAEIEYGFHENHGNKRISKEGVE